MFKTDIELYDLLYVELEKERRQTYSAIAKLCYPYQLGLPSIDTPESKEFCEKLTKLWDYRDKLESEMKRRLKDQGKM